MKSPWLLVFFLLFFSWLGALRIYDLSWPFANADSKSDAIGSANFHIAANHLRYGYSATKGLQVMNPQETPREGWVYYSNHPATFTVVESLFFKLASGPGVLAAGIAPFLAFLVQLLALWMLAARIYDKFTATAAVLVYSAMPMTLLYGDHVNYEPFCLASVILFAERISAGKRGQAALVVFLGGLFDYAALFPAFVYAPWILFRRYAGKRDSKIVDPWVYSFILAVACIFPVAIHFFHVSFVPRDVSYIEYIKNVLSSAEKFGEAIGFSWGAFFLSQAGFLSAGFCFTGLALAGVGLFSEKPKEPVVVLMISAFFYILLFRYHAHVHEFWTIYLAPPFAIFAARAVSKFSSSGIIKPTFKGLVAGLVLLLFLVEGGFRYLEARDGEAWKKPQQWAHALEKFLPKRSVAIMVDPTAPPFRAVECFTKDLALWPSAMVSQKDIDDLKKLIVKYHQTNRRIFVVIQENEARRIEQIHGKGTLHTLMAGKPRFGKRMNDIKPGDKGEPGFRVWEMTHTFFP